MKTQTLLSAAMLVLAACGSKSDGNGSSAAAGGGGAVSLEPGEWEMKTEVVNVSAEGLPAGIADSMKAQAAATTRDCMTPEEAKGPKGDMFAQNNPANCKTEGFSWSGGKISGKTTCTGSGGAGATTMTMDGTYGPQNIDMTMKSETDLAGKAMTMEMRVTGRRIGECPAGKAG